MKKFRLFLVLALLVTLFLASPKTQQEIIRLTSDGWLVAPGDSTPLLLGSDGKAFVRIESNGAVTFPNSSSSFRAPAGTAAAPSYSFADDTDTGFFQGTGNTIGISTGGSQVARWDTTSLWILPDASGLYFGNSADVFVGRDAADTLALRRTTNAQTLNLYKTYTDGSNYERMRLGWDSGTTRFVLAGEAAGTGTGRNIGLNAPTGGGIVFMSGGSGDDWFINSSGNLVGLSATTSLVGYSAGGAQTQSTNKATTVTLNAGTGNITMNAANLAADTSVSFTLTNSTIAANDYIMCQHISAGTLGAYTCTAIGGSGSATVTVRNVSPGALAEAIVLKFFVFKAAIA